MIVVFFLLAIVENARVMLVKEGIEIVYVSWEQVIERMCR